MIELFAARSGAPSLKVGGVAMHSPYDPVREAERFVRQSLGEEKPSTVIVLGECLGHVTEAVARLRPGAVLIAAVIPRRSRRRRPCREWRSWHPGITAAVLPVPEDHLDELQVEGLRVLEWPPAAHAFPGVSRAANEAVRQVVQELNGSFVTTVGFRPNAG